MTTLIGRISLALFLGCAAGGCSSDDAKSDTSSTAATGAAERDSTAPARDNERQPRQQPAPRPAAGGVGTSGSGPDATASRQPPPKADGPKVNADAAILKDFKDRVDAYMKLHDKQEKGAAEPRESSDPAKIRAAQDTLAARLQAARKDAKHGDIFTPEIRQLFRRLMYPELTGPDAKETKETMKLEDAQPTRAEMLKVNARYPEQKALPTVPPNILMRIPQLPDALEYRIVGKDLILRDVNANLIVDFIPNAIQ